MKEAFRLLNKSIIRVETPDIDFEDDQELIEGQEESQGGRERAEREGRREREGGGK